MSSTTDHRFALNVHRTARSSAPTVHIFLQRVVRHANGMMSVTPLCGSLAEIEGEIARLQHELDGVLQQARQAFDGKSGARPA
ncbi:MAG TPA: hypothetical protein VFN08_11675 [Gemmatimonadales bacterium]|jgi:hypothetical protein|nr:hypothetical protein [Gemmatimonadales bacterium]